MAGYSILRGVGQGGFGEVYFAITIEGKEVALKWIGKQANVEVEGVKTIWNKPHANLVRTIDVHQGEHTWIVMEFIRGESLRQIIARHRNGLETRDILNTMKGLTDGLAHLHRFGIIHRDLKPANVLFQNFCVQIIDFGLARPSHSGESNSWHPRGIIGTIEYMAPEQGTGAQPAPTADLYALGVILYEMVTGHPPFRGNTVEVREAHLHAKIPLDGVPDLYVPILAKALAKEPNDRYPSAEAFYQALEQALRPAGQMLAPVAAAGPSRWADQSLAERVDHLAESLERRTGGVIWLIVKYGLVALVGLVLAIGLPFPGGSWVLVAVIVLLASVGLAARWVIVEAARSERRRLADYGLGELLSDLERPTDAAGSASSRRPVTPVTRGTAPIRRALSSLPGSPPPTAMAWNRLAEALGWVVEPTGQIARSFDQRGIRGLWAIWHTLILTALASGIAVGGHALVRGDQTWLGSDLGLWQVVPILAQITWLGMSMTAVAWVLVGMRFVLDELQVATQQTPRRRSKRSGRRRGEGVPLDGRPPAVASLGGMASSSRPAAYDETLRSASRQGGADSPPGTEPEIETATHPLKSAPLWDVISLGLAVLVGLGSLGIGAELMVRPSLDTVVTGSVSFGSGGLVWAGLLVSIAWAFWARLPLVTLPAEDAGWLPAVFLGVLPAAVLVCVIPDQGPTGPFLIYGAAVAFRLSMASRHPDAPGRRHRSEVASRSRRRVVVRPPDANDSRLRRLGRRIIQGRS